MIKVFEAVGSSPRKLEVEPEGDGEFSLCVVDHQGKYHTIFLSSDTAPALALAILEAAGYGEEVVTDGSPDGHVRVAKYYLYEGVKAHASITAEAKAQAELEAEALELYQLWETLQSDDETVWLAVARRAREMREGK